jgi:glutathione S-transferase
MRWRAASVSYRRKGIVMTARLTLISHHLCPYVQRVAIVLQEKNLPFERIDIDLANKPDWFLRVSPLGKTPVLLVDGEAIFESAVICEYLEESMAPPLHPAHVLTRARHRGWMEFGSSLLNAIGSFYNAPDESSLHRRAEDIRDRFLQLEDVLSEGPYFAGDKFCMVDAVFGPVFRYFDVFDAFADFGFMAATADVRAWRKALRIRPSVRAAAPTDYDAALRDFLLRRESALSTLMKSALT